MAKKYFSVTECIRCMHRVGIHPAKIFMSAIAWGFDCDGKTAEELDEMDILYADEWLVEDLKNDWVFDINLAIAEQHKLPEGAIEKYREIDGLTRKELIARKLVIPEYFFKEANSWKN